MENLDKKFKRELFLQKRVNNINSLGFYIIEVFKNQIMFHKVSFVKSKEYEINLTKPCSIFKINHILQIVIPPVGNFAKSEVFI